MSPPQIAGVAFGTSAFRMEDQDGPQTDELAAFELYQRGRPLLPEKWPLWKQWLTRVQDMSEHCTITRVVLLSTPPSDYQAWRIWGAHWNRLYGEQMLFMPRSQARELAVPLGNWWWLDDEKLLIDGQVVTDGRVERYRRGSVLALQHATATETAVV